VDPDRVDDIGANREDRAHWEAAQSGYAWKRYPPTGNHRQHNRRYVDVLEVMNPMRSKLARALRKWADLIDPSVKPSVAGEMVVKITCDASELNAGLEEIRVSCLRLAEAAGPKLWDGK
jgi:hypothetical protein